MGPGTIYLFLLLGATYAFGMLAVRRQAPLPHRILAWLPGITIPVETLAILVGHFYRNNHWVYNSWLPLECGSLLLVFYKSAGHPATRRLLKWLLLLLPIGIAGCYLVSASFQFINVYALLFFLFCELLGGFVFLTDCLLSSDDASIFKHPLSWTAVGVILYACVFILTHATWIFTIAVTISHAWYSALILLGNTLLYGFMMRTFFALT
jgi:hypothetical protein